MILMDSNQTLMGDVKNWSYSTPIRFFLVTLFPIKCYNERKKFVLVSASMKLLSSTVCFIVFKIRLKLLRGKYRRRRKFRDNSMTVIFTAAEVIFLAFLAAFTAAEAPRSK